MRKDPQGTLEPRYQVGRVLQLFPVTTLRFVVDTL